VETKGSVRLRGGKPEGASHEGRTMGAEAEEEMRERKVSLRSRSLEKREEVDTFERVLRREGYRELESSSLVR